VQPVAVLQIPAKGAVKAGLGLPGGNLLVGGGGWGYQDRQGIDAGRKAGGAHQQMASQQQGQGFALHGCLGC
jgi:hypothetical protein